MNRLRIIRKNKGFSPDQVVEHFKTVEDIKISTRASLHRMESGVRNVTLKQLEAFAELYGVNIGELVTDDFDAQINTGLLEEVVSYALQRCQDSKVDEKSLAKVISITYARCQEKSEDERTEKIKEKIDDMLVCAL